jgi:MFS family permease
MSTFVEDAGGPRAIRNLVVLILAQALVGAQMPMIFTFGGLAGQSLASNPCFATLPISMIVFGSMTTAPWMSQIMHNFGRRVGFWIGVTGGAVGAIIAAYALSIGSFWLLVFGSYFTGIYQSAQGFFRFAAIDTVTPEFRPKAISWAMAGGLGAAIFGPQLAALATDIFAVPFLGTYLVVICVNMLGAVLFLFLDIPKPPRPVEGSSRGRTRMEMLKTPRILVAVITAAVSYSLMSLVMTSTPLAVVGCGFQKADAANIVTSHVLAMFIPSFFTGHLIARFGTQKIVATGLTILAVAGVVGYTGVELENFYIALVLLGIGWNFGFIGASTMLANSHSPEERGRIQGINDMIVFGSVTVASLASGGLMNCSGSSVIQGWDAVNLAMAPFLALAGGALIWLMLRPKDA